MCARGVPLGLALASLFAADPVTAEPATEATVHPGVRAATQSPGPWTARRVAAVGIMGATYAGAWAFASAAWWTSADSSPTFHFRDEGGFGLDTYAGGADKLGHLYANYLATRLYDGILEWGGFSRMTSLVTATSLTTTFFVAVELKDGYQNRYGFSLADLGADLGGQALALALELVPPVDSAFSLRLSYVPSRDYLHQRSARARLDLLEDYSGQTYLLCFHLAALPTIRRFSALSVLRYADLSLGFSALGFEPVPRVPTPVRQAVSLGVSLNLQRVFDELLAQPNGQLSTGARAVHFANEVLQLPSTRVPVVTLERSGAPLSRRP